MRISDWSSDVCSSDLHPVRHLDRDARGAVEDAALVVHADPAPEHEAFAEVVRRPPLAHALGEPVGAGQSGVVGAGLRHRLPQVDRKRTRLNSSHTCAYRMPSSSCKKNYKNKTISP